ncbi:hypothetical protein NUU61_006627 [Penicillium alfredii]|uniref:UBC core domain-containing protein n=1 Tax=Penicillium alfredii TaxID=1506179 RepID=A0A9W9K4F5_9EURO|nr:uncharacterized protein NUU61_006627 [Penicillium alfredii]KAJ5091757.1 hypothetical protein NUU61_006627 [Penicillium alfredii]
MVSNLRRLAADHAALHSANLPPYYLLPPDDGRSSSDDLSHLTVLLTGPPGTPYSQGLWRLRLKMPDDYPNSPPKATFTTRIWHPNVEELTGAVCVDTLKRDWKPKLTLRDVLVTISCLLIYPNPDSALNSAAGSLLQEDYEAFSHQAKLMTSIHARIPSDLQASVTEATMRGEDAGSADQEKDDTRVAHPRKQRRIQNGTNRSADHAAQPPQDPPATDDMSDSGNDDPSKENDPSLSPSPVKLAPPSPRKNALGKRPLSVLSMPGPEDADADMMLVDSDSESESQVMNSEKNISANTAPAHPSASPRRKSPKLSSFTRGAHPLSSSRMRDDLLIYEDLPETSILAVSRRSSGNGKENCDAVGLALGLKDKRGHSATKAAGHGNTSLSAGYAQPLSASSSSSSASLYSSSSSTAAGSSTSSSSLKASKKSVAGARKVSSSAVAKVKPRIGVRRL